MNRIYKVIWNEALNCFVAVGEYAKARGKSSKSSVSANARINTTATTSVKKWHVSAIGLGLLAAGVAMPASALGLYFAGDDPTPKIYTNEWLHHTVTIKGGETVAGDPSSKNINVTANKNSKTLTVKLDKTVNLGVDGSLKMGDTLVDSSGMTIKAINPINNVTLSNSGLNNGGNKITNVASGAGDDNNAANIGDLNNAIAANKTKYYSVNSTGGSNYDNLGATGENAMAMGRNASAAGSQSIAIGSVANGKPTSASGEQSIAIGANVVTTGGSAIAIGGDDLNAASETNLDGSSNIGANTGSVNTVFKTYTGRNLVEPAYYARNTEASGAASIAIGSKALSKGHLSTAVGVQSSSDGVASSAFGMGSSASKDGSVALGAGSTTLNDATYQEKLTIGNKDYFYAGATNDKGAQVSVGSEERERQIKHVASGEVSATSTDGINGSQLHATNESVKDLTTTVAANKTHFYSVNSTDSTRGNYNNDGATGADAMAAGIDASATGENATALGTKSNAEGTRSTAIGYQAQAKDRNAIALGYQANAHQKHSTAIGYAANAGYAAIAIGDAAAATKKGSTAIGSQSVSTDVYSTALGREAKALEKNTVAVGYSTTASGESSVAIGNKSLATKESNIALGDNAQATGNQSIAQGRNAKATGSQSIAQGTHAEATGNFSSAQGYFAKATKSGAIAQGRDAKAFGENSIAQGMKAKAEGKSSVAIGDGAKASGVNSIAIGTGNIVNGDNSGAFGDPNNISGTGSYAVGNNNTINADNSFVLGNNVTINASDKYSIALGEGAVINGEDSIAIGRGATAAASTRNGLAIGVRSSSGNHAASLGDDATSGNYAVALGSKSTAQIGGTAIGQASSAVSNATALGRAAIAGQPGNVALGHQSVTAAQHTGTFAINNQPVAGLTSGARTVSVGSVGAERQIQNVAPGVVDATSTDAINGSQLFQTNKNVTANTIMAEGNMAALGGNYIPDPNDPDAAGTYETPEYFVFTDPSNVDTVADGGTGVVVNNVGDAFTAINEALQTPLTFTGDTGTATRKLGQTLSVTGGATGNLTTGNLGVEADETGGLIIKLAETVNLDADGSVTTGNSVLNTNGLIIAGGPSMTTNGINAGDKQIKNVASGVGDDYNAANIGDVKNAIGDVTTLGFGIKAADTNTVQKNLGQTIDIIGSNGNITTQVDSGKVEVVLNNNLDLDTNGSIKMGTSTPFGLGPVTNVNRYGMTTSNALAGTSINLTGVTVASPLGITNLNSTGLYIVGGPSVTTNGVNAGNRKVVNVDKGDITATSTDGINGSQLFDNAQSIADNFGGGSMVKPDGTVSAPGYALNGGTYSSVGDALGNLDTRTFTNTTNIAKGIKFNVNNGLEKTFALGEEIKLNTDSNLTTTPLSTGDGIELGLAPVVNVGTDNPVQINGDTGTISGLTNRTFDPTITYTGGQAATQEQLSDLSGTIIDLGFEITADNASLAPGETKDKVKLGETVKYTSADGSIVTTVADNEIDFALGDNLSVGGPGLDGEDGVDGFIGVNGADGQSGIALNGADGTIGLTGPAGLHGEQGPSGTIGVTNGVPGVNGEDGITRIIIDDIQVATMEDGIKFAGNKGATIAKQLNETLNIEGTLANSADASGANLRVDSDNGKLNLMMAKKLTDLDSITINEGGPIISSSGIDMGSNTDDEDYPTNTITNLGKGVNGTDAVNLDQLNEVNETANKGWFVRTDSGDGAKSNVKPDDVVTINGDGNISVTNEDNNLVVALGDDLSVGGLGLNGEDGVDGFIGVNGADGVSGVAINGADGTIGLTGPAGIDGVSPTLTMRPEIQSGDVFNDDTDVTRLSYEDGDGNSRTIATLEDDGLRFSGNDNPAVGYVTRNLNKEMQIVGSKTAVGTYSSGNINTIATQDGGIEIQMADSPKFGEVTINAENTGKITGLTAGEDDTDAVNVYQLNQTNATINQGLDFGGDSGTDVNRKLGQKLIVKGDDTINADPATKNISVTADGDDTLNIRLDKDINLGNTGSVTTGNTQVNNAGVTVYNGDNDQVALTNNGLNNGNNKITNVADGLLDAGSRDVVNGSQLFKTNQDIAKGIKIGDGNVANDQQFALGETINVTGDGNITTLASAAGVQVRLNNQLNLGDEGRMQVGSSLMTNNSFTFVSDNAPNRTVRLTNNGLDNGFNRITNVAAGIDFTDAATVGQLEAATFALDQGWGLSAQGDSATMVKQGSAVDINSRDGNITISRTIAGNGISPLASRAADVNDISFELNRDIAIDSVQAGDSTLSNDGLTIVGGPSMTKAGINAADTKVTNVMSGEVSASSSDAINGSQLYAQGAGISTLIGGDTVYNPEDGTFTNANIGGTGQSSIDGAIASIKQGETIINESIATNTTNIEANTADIATNTTNISTNTTNIQGNTDRLDTGLNFGADSGDNINKPIGDDSVLSFTGGNNITTTAQGSSILFDLNGNISVDSVSTGNTTINSGGVTITDGPSMTADGLYAGGKSITGVADGVEATDAVNLGQLSALDSRLNNSMSDLGYKIGEVEDDANAGISAAMAMSSLPQAYISGKSLISGGVGTYNGESAVAIGFSKLSNDGRWVMKINGTADTQGNAGGSIGAGFHFD
ncbi:ESPR-type extended signal peptide-containing protein [Psychrobacter sp. L7]|uniref:ESPR-type extended signal peptide-containing protein n=2 Tax=Psychrobacter TaxID=497 RepID=UPI00128FCF88|nr:YadA-like family protein [Psychrobacter sp. L7]